MRVDIQPQWKNLAEWYWETLEGKTKQNAGMSIWDMLYNEYGAVQGYNGKDMNRLMVHFPDEHRYTTFLLRWS